MERLYTIKELTEVFQLNYLTIYKLCKGGQIPYIKIGGSIRVKQSELKKLLGE